MDTELFTSIVANMSAKMTEKMPAVITTTLIILIGWFIARLLAGLVQRFINRTKLNTSFANTGLGQEVIKIAPNQTLAEIAKRVIFWFLWVYIIFLALTSAGFDLQNSPFSSILTFLPRLLAAFLILVGGALLAQLVGRWVQVGIAATGVEFHEALGKGTRMVLLMIVFITAIEALGINLTPLTNALTSIITIFVAGLALAFGIGAKDVVRNILAGYYAREHFSLGDIISLDEKNGTLEAIGTVSAEIHLPDGRLVIPNSTLTEKAVKIKGSVND